VNLTDKVAKKERRRECRNDGRG